MSSIKMICRSRLYGLKELALVVVATMLAPATLSAQAPETKPSAARSNRHAPLARPPLPRLSDNERAELKRLQQEDPKAFREEIKKLVRRHQRETDKEQKQLRELANKAKMAKGDERKKLVQKLKKLVASVFDRRMKDNWKRYKNAAKRLQELKSALKKREQHRDDIVAGKVDSLLKDPALKW